MTITASASVVAFAFTAGVFTFFAPCAYPLLPGYISFYLGRSTAEPAANGGTAMTGSIGTTPQSTPARLARAGIVGVLVSVGFFLVYAVLAGIVVALGSQFLTGISILELLVGAMLVGIGIAMAAGWKPTLPTTKLPQRRRSAAGYVGFGVLYAAAAAGCSAPIFVAVALKALAADPAVGVATFGAYAMGMSVLMIGVTVLAALGRDAVLRHLTRRIDLIYRVAGGLLIVAGLVQIYFFLFRFDGLRLLGF